MINLIFSPKITKPTYFLSAVFGSHSKLCRQKRRRLCLCVHAQSCLTRCDPTACIWPGSSVHGISQARILEWVAISFSRIFSRSFTVSSEFVSRARSQPPALA